jgi:hypothetical protein
MAKCKRVGLRRLRCATGGSRLPAEWLYVQRRNVLPAVALHVRTCWNDGLGSRHFSVRMSANHWRIDWSIDLILYVYIYGYPKVIKQSRVSVRTITQLTAIFLGLYQTEQHSFAVAAVLGLGSEMRRSEQSRQVYILKTIKVSKWTRIVGWRLSRAFYLIHPPYSATRGETDHLQRPLHCFLLAPCAPGSRTSTWLH